MCDSVCDIKWNLFIEGDQIHLIGEPKNQISSNKGSTSSNNQQLTSMLLQTTPNQETTSVAKVVNLGSTILMYVVGVIFLGVHS